MTLKDAMWTSTESAIRTECDLAFARCRRFPPRLHRPLSRRGRWFMLGYLSGNSVVTPPRVTKRRSARTSSGTITARFCPKAGERPLQIEAVKIDVTVTKVARHLSSKRHGGDAK